MTLRARIVLVVIGVMPTCFVLVVAGMIYEVLSTKQEAAELRRQLLIEGAERIYARELLTPLEQLPPSTGITGLLHGVNRLDVVRESPDGLLESWVLYLADGELAKARPDDLEAIPDDEENRLARAEALESSAPIVRGDTVWRRVQFGRGEEARTVAVLGMRLRGGSTLAFDLSNQVRLILFVAAIGTFTVVALLWWTISAMVFEPVDRLAEGANRVSAGDYSYRVPHARRGDELSHFIQVFNDMVAHVQDYSVNLETRVAEATEQVRESEKRLAVASRLAATGRLAAEIAHEINNPVGGMINAARTLRRKVEEDKLKPERAKDYLDLILDGLARIEHTVREVLSFARRELRTAPVHLREPMERAVNLCKHKADLKDIALTWSAGEDLPQVFGDAGELQQVLLNLLINAVDATPPGGRVELRAHAVEPAEEGQTPSHVVIEVRDTGVGMPPEIRDQIFDAFFTTKPEGEGTGIGLAIVHNIVTSHHGEISVESEPGDGTTFRIQLPVYAEERQEPA